MDITIGGIAVAVVLVVLAFAVLWGIMSAMRGAPPKSAARTGPAPVAEDQLRPLLIDFHVHGDTAKVHYSVPLPEGEVDEHLRQLLRHDASLVLHDKRAHGLPIDQVTRAIVYGRRHDAPVEIGVLELEEPGVIPEVAAPELTPRAAVAGYDPLAHLGEQEFEIQPGVAGREPREGLSPFLDEITIARSVEAQLRAVGVDPSHVSLEDLSLSLLRVGGYDVAIDRAGVATIGESSAEIYTARKAGSESMVVVIEHGPGDHPELSEQVVNAFVIAVAQRNPQRALLITDKFSPYVVYEKERNDPRCRFITRERLQSFVDSFALT